MRSDLMPAGPHDWPVLRALTQIPVCPDAATGLPRQGWLAMAECPIHGLRPVGAALLHVAGHEAAAWIAVAAPWRRQGWGLRLWQACVDRAAALGVERVASWQAVGDAVGLDFCARRGLHLANTLEHFEATLSDAERFFGAFQQRLAARGSLPTELALRYDGDIDWRLFEPLMAQEFGPAMAARLDRIAALGLAAHEWACALMLGEQPVAVTLCSMVEGCVSHDAYLVMPEFRHGWAHITCKYLAARDLRLRFPGVERYSFSSSDRHGDTRKAARRSAERGMATRSVRIERWYHIDLAPRLG